MIDYNIVCHLFVDHLIDIYFIFDHLIVDHSLTHLIQNERFSRSKTSLEKTENLSKSIKFFSSDLKI